MSGPLAGAGSPRRRREELPVRRRVGSWLVWWSALMSLWTVLDYSVAFAELWVGAGVAALGAFLTEVVLYQSGTQVRLRVGWAAHAVRLPVEVARDTVVVFFALGRRLLRGDQPAARFLEVAVACGDDSPEGVTRRVLLVAGKSIAPNTVVLGLDRDRGVMVIHRLVSGSTGSGRHRRRGAGR